MDVQNSQSEDPFDTLLTLEDSLYTTAYATGIADGARAGRIEGRIFGLEKGFEKFASLGQLQGRVAVWGARLPPSTSSQAKQGERGKAGEGSEKELQDEEGESGLPKLAWNPRVETHIQTLHALTEPETFSTENTEEAVVDFDDRFKRASAKTKVIDRIIGESDQVKGSEAGDGSSPKKGRRMKVSGEARKEDNMEDFGDSRILS
ncbi:hypothetical protein K469DRAFT_579501 [Zopfia rhizophila CBS 207.26]|uniref:Essential protein Yae1 N-terminal domain-containing protein n=1 Tax=Zopfia rhizophila CBS 207.26 TaxID=1314779 RepID=A0A6A6DZL4_9PEZI|nr:hypothetical protein K469DRAFT_579501 [Zopfia rhizophila CBS 207.26]